MGVHRCITSGPCEVFPVLVGDMFSSLWVLKALGQPEVDHVDQVLLFPNADQKIVWFDVPV